MNTQEEDFNILQNNTSCILQQNSCKEHFGKCSNVWIMAPPLHNFLHRLPGELQRIVIAKTIVPQSPCIKHVFDHCYNPWECKAGAHTFDSAQSQVTPSTCYTSKCQLLHQEGYKIFFQNNVFIFNSRVHAHLRVSLRDPVTVREWFHDLDLENKHDRDDRATRDGKGSKRFKGYVDNSSYTNIDEYRYVIRHLVLQVGDKSNLSEGRLQPTWAWALKVDWKTLPDLQTLVLDLMGYSYLQLQSRPFPQELYDEQLEAGAKRMECLKLKSLIIYGLCSGPEYWGSKQHKRKMEELFQPALAQNGKLELRDEELFVAW